MEISNILAFLASALALITAIIGFLLEIYKSSKTPETAGKKLVISNVIKKTPHVLKINNAAKLWVFIFLISSILLLCTILFYEYNNIPYIFIKTTFQNIDSNGDYDFEQTQSYFLPWSIFKNRDAELLLRAVDLSSKGQLPGISMFSTSSFGYSFLSKPSSSIKSNETFAKGGQYHIVANVKKGFGSRFSSGNQLGWWYCPDWTGLNYKLTKVAQNKEALFILDFSRLADQGSCSGHFGPDGTPRIKWISPRLSTKHDDSKNLYCTNELDRMIALDDEMCIWYGKVSGADKGEITLRWLPKR